MNNMTERYKHTQIGYLIIVLMITVLFLMAYLMTVLGFNWIGFAVIFLLLACLILFGTLTVAIEKGFIEIRFGPGVFKKKIRLEDIESCKVVKNPWYYGWGVRKIPHGWLYNVSGFHAVEITMKTGKKYRIGTDVPHELEKAIQNSI